MRIAHATHRSDRAPRLHLTGPAQSVSGGQRDGDPTGVFVPTGTPRAIVNKLNQSFNAAIRAPEVLQRLRDVGMERIGMAPEQYEKILRSEVERDALLVKRLGLRAE